MCMQQAAATGAGLVPAYFGMKADQRATAREARATAEANIAQMQQDADVAKLRNNILNEYVGRQKDFTADNQGAFKGAVDGYGAPAIESSRVASEADRGGFLQKQAGSGPQTVAPTLESQSPAVQSELARKMGEAFASVQGGASRAAKLGSFGDSLTTAGDGAQASARKIDTTNNFARGEIAMLPADQDLQEFVLRKPIIKRGANPNNPSSTLKGLSSLVSSVVGAYGGNIAGTLGSMVNSAGSSANAFANGFASPTQRA